MTSRNTVYQGSFLRLERWTVQLPDGRLADRDVVRHPGAVAVLAEPAPGSVLCVKQFRPATGQCLLEVPAGKLEPEEAPEQCARRELAEETGYHATSWKPLYSFYTSPGFADERITLFYATGLTPGPARPDADEYVEVVTLSREQVATAVAAGDISDAKTLVALLWWLAQPLNKA
ncbi:MAG: NUDIX hydrolase [Alicyclobacillus sp.]|nr:NUDIX hydrolase [Alicyclobacillus sp.]